MNNTNSPSTLNKPIKLQDTKEDTENTEKDGKCNC
jgi:hypothetical protein